MAAFQLLERYRRPIGGAQPAAMGGRDHEGIAVSGVSPAPPLARALTAMQILLEPGPRVRAKGLAPVEHPDGVVVIQPHPGQER